MTWLPYVALVAATGAVWAAWVAVEIALQRRRRRRGLLSAGWLTRQAWRDMRAGDAWEGPRWRTPREVSRMRRAEERQMKLAERRRA